LPWPLIIAAMILCAGMMFVTMHVIEMMDRHRPPDPQPPDAEDRIERLAP
jgi:hypothetical protein